MCGTQLNRDILAHLLVEGKDDGNVSVQDAFAWLQTMTFVQQDTDGWQYHSVVRRLMLRYQRMESPQKYQHLHNILAQVHNANRQKVNNGQDEWSSDVWQRETLSYLYHILATNPYSHWSTVISALVQAMYKRFEFALKIADNLDRDDLYDEVAEEQKKFIQFARQQLQAADQEKSSESELLTFFETISNIPNLTVQVKAYTYFYRGSLYALMKRYSEALVDFDRAIALDEKLDRAIAQRGETYRQMKRYSEALTDFDRAIALDEKDSWAIALRGITYRQMERYQEALADFDHAIALDEKDSWAIARRGETYLQMKSYEEALADFDRAIALDEKDSWAIAQRGKTYRQMERYQEALADFDHAITLDNNDWSRYERALVHLLMGGLEKSAQDIAQSIVKARAVLQQTPDDYTAAFNLALYYLALGDTTEAINHYETLLTTCSSVLQIQEAIDDLKDLMTVRPQDTAATTILAQLETRLAALQSPSAF